MKKSRSLVALFFSLLWGLSFVHYYVMLQKYADLGVHVSNPVLYVAVETWMLASLAALTWLALYADGK